MAKQVLCVLLLLAAFGFARDVQFPAVKLSDGWSIVGVPLPHEVIEFRILLKQQNLDVLEDIFWRVSDPKHPDYGKYLSKKEILDLISPPVEDQNLVDWLINQGAISAESFGDFIKSSATVETVEKLFHTSVQLVRDERNGEISSKFIESYSLPARIAKVARPLAIPTLTQLIHKMHFVHPLKIFPASFDVDGESIDSQYSSDLVVPQTARNLYNISSDIIITTNSSVNVAEFTSNSFSQQDMAKFVQGCALQTPNHIKTVGPHNPANPDEECTLDIQWITAIAANATNQYTTSTQWLIEMAQDLFNQDDPPLVTSISWGTDERQEGYQYNSQCDTEFMKLGTRGCTILASSGDSGAAGGPCGQGQNPFNPIYPTTSPYVVSVGATMLQTATPFGQGEPPVCQTKPFGMACAEFGVEVPADDPQGGYATGGAFRCTRHVRRSRLRSLTTT